MTQELSNTSRQHVALAAVLIGVAVALLPVWDAIDKHAMFSAMSGALGTAGKGPPFPPAGIAYPIAAFVLGWSIYKGFPRSRPRAFGLYALGVVVVLLYVGATGYDTATTRSHAVDSWAVCETATSPGGRSFRGTSKRKPMFDGPHLDSGDPCTTLAEDRLAHLREHRDGDLADGLVQIWKRFPKDRDRVLWGSLAVVAMAAVAGVLLKRANT